MSNNQAAITTAGMIILCIEAAAIIICFGFWFKAMGKEIQNLIHTLTTKKDTP